ncbi:MAG: hypothetical protein E7609_03235 [Ruminococcaceae bacterium]|nr:hypothetical protein [Oscillospiraceae bacterium]
MKSTKKLTVTALLSALGTVLLTLGSLLEVLDLSMAAIVSCFVVFLRIELGGAYPYLFWATTALCSLVIMPSSSAGLLFALLGLYPLTKAILERRPPIVEWTCKLLLAGGILTVFVLVAKFVLLLPDAILTGWLLPIFLTVALTAFVLYDIALSRLILFYGLRIRPRIARFLK